MGQEGRTVRVLVVDDHPVVREGLRAMLTGENGIEVVGEAANGEEAIEQSLRLEPDVALVDIRMPGISGIEVTERIKLAQPGTAVIILTMYDSEMYVVEAIRAGAAGYLLKDSTREILVRAIHSVVDGGTIVGSRLLHQAIEGLVRSSCRVRGGKDGLSVTERFTAREMDVLRHVAQGHANKQIGKHLNLAEVTIKKHVQSIIGKMGVSDRTHAAVLAVRLGLVE
ncbi:MAG: response regulator transcription factor [Dehalococcoidia bacterium]